MESGPGTTTTTRLWEWVLLLLRTCVCWLVRALVCWFVRVFRAAVVASREQEAARQASRQCECAQSLASFQFGVWAFPRVSLLGPRHGAGHLNSLQADPCTPNPAPTYRVPRCSGRAPRHVVHESPLSYVLSATPSRWGEVIACAVAALGVFLDILALPGLLAGVGRQYASSPPACTPASAFATTHAPHAAVSGSHGRPSGRLLTAAPAASAAACRQKGISPVPVMCADGHFP